MFLEYERRTVTATCGRRILEAWHTGSGVRVGVKRFDAATRLLQAEAALREYMEDDQNSDEWSGIGSSDERRARDGELDHDDNDDGGEVSEETLVERRASLGEGTEHKVSETHEAACVTVDVVGTVTLWQVVRKS